MEDVIVLGGGIAGLGAAYLLSKKGVSCTLIEKEKELGGIARCHHFKDYDFEEYYHHFFNTDKVLMEFIEELGLSEELIWSPSETSFYYDKGFYRFDGPLDLLNFKPLSIVDRFKLGVGMLTLGSGENLDGLNAEDWLKSKFGSSVYEKLFKPLLKTKFGVDLKKGSAAFVHGRLKARAGSRKGVKEELGYYKGGLSKLIDEIEEKIISNGGKIIKDCKVERISRKDNEFIVETNKDVFESKIVLNALPLSILRDLVSFELEDKVKSIEYRGVVCLSYVLKEKFSDYYWTNNLDQNLPFGAVIEHTNWMRPEDYNGDYLMHVVQYCGMNEKIYKMSDKEVEELFTKGLEEMNPEFSRNTIKEVKVARDGYGTPIFDVGYGNRMPGIETSTPGLYLAGSFQVYPGSRNVDNILDKGFKAAEVVLKELK